MAFVLATLGQSCSPFGWLNICHLVMAFVLATLGQSLKRIKCGPGFPIQRSLDQSFLPAPQSFSQANASFIACNRQGIHHMHLFAWPYNVKPSALQPRRHQCFAFKTLLPPDWFKDPAFAKVCDWLTVTITSHLVGVFCRLSGMASCHINRKPAWYNQNPLFFPYSQI